MKTEDITMDELFQFIKAYGLANANGNNEYLLCVCSRKFNGDIWVKSGLTGNSGIDGRRLMVNS